MKGKAKSLRNGKVLFEGKTIPKTEIGKVWRRDSRVFGIVSVKKKQGAKDSKKRLADEQH